MTRAVAAFFDMDYTLVAANTAAMYVRYLRREGLATRRDVVRMAWWSLQYRLGTVDIDAVVGRVVAAMQGDSEAELRARCVQWFAEEVQPFVSPDGRRTVEQHRAQGHRVILLTGSSPYASAPVAEDLGIEDVLCTRMEVQDGRFTGQVVDPICFGNGKVQWAERFAADAGIDLSLSYFYTDSHTDLPMLERVGQPRVVNPDGRLAREAHHRGWPVLHFRRG